MVKNYSTKKIPNAPKSPSESTIQFLLNYSKSLHFIETKGNNDTVEMNLN